MAATDNKTKSQKPEKEIFGVGIATWSYLAIAVTGAVYVLPRLTTALNAAGEAASAEAEEANKADQTQECAAQARKYARQMRNEQGFWTDLLTRNQASYKRFYDKSYKQCINA